MVISDSRPPQRAAPSREASPAAAAPPQWKQALTGLQQNCQRTVHELSSNLSRLQSGVSRQLLQLQAPARRTHALPLASLSQSAAVGASWSAGSGSRGDGGLVSREEVGRATWTFLHTLAAQYPNKPSRQQQQDARNLVDILTRMYPCGECARHFGEVVRAHPPQLASRAAFSLWMCEVHNTVNRRLDKPVFNCALVESRWAGIECEDEAEGGGSACSLDIGRRRR